MNTAVDDDLIEAGPVHERRQRPAKRRRLEPATIEELDTIVAHMPDKWKLMIELASWCTMPTARSEPRQRPLDGVIQVHRGTARTSSSAT